MIGVYGFSLLFSQEFKFGKAAQLLLRVLLCAVKVAELHKCMQRGSAGCSGERAALRHGREEQLFAYFAVSKLRNARLHRNPLRRRKGIAPACTGGNRREGCRVGFGAERFLRSFFDGFFGLFLRFYYGNFPMCIVIQNVGFGNVRLCAKVNRVRVAQQRIKNPVRFAFCAGNIKRVDSASGFAHTIRQVQQVFGGVFACGGYNKIFFRAGQRNIEYTHFLRKVQTALLKLNRFAGDGGKTQPCFGASALAGKAQIRVEQNLLLSGGIELL